MFLLSGWVGGWAHPRVCGENSTARQAMRSAWGSSPRVRGKPCLSRTRSTSMGLIPACAGKTAWPPRAEGAETAHPRVCGENVSTRYGHVEAPGSSPRVRGKQELGDLPHGRVGLIPACAGKTGRSDHATTPPPAHPRVCGENGGDLLAPPGARGSSPRVRGKPPTAQRSAREGGLIPACAGKTGWRRGRRCGGWAHPRVCGENTRCGAAGPLVFGSSPRVRGKRVPGHPHAAPARLIPACAGKTS